MFIHMISIILLSQLIRSDWTLLHYAISGTSMQISVGIQLLMLVKLQARVKQSRQAEAFDEQPEMMNGLGNSEDEVYEEAREKKKRKKDAKTSKYAVKPTAPPLEEEVVAGPRKVTREVDQNRGLTPHRRKDMKNPRVKVR